jgi:Holliday junction resolvase RusA-like endonuclease
MIRIEIPGIPPSINSCFVNGKKQGIRFKSDAYKEWEKKVNAVMAKIKSFPVFIGPVSVEIEIYRPDWLTSKGEARKSDISNRIKTLEDSVFKNLEIDDSWVWDISAKKMDANEFKSVITIYSLRDH